MTRREPSRLPVATYRLQLGGGFGFARAAEIVDYLDALGVSDCYLSPVTRARPGSAHGYDVVDPGSLDPELGGEEAFRDLAGKLRERGMGILLDIVPNHMCISSAENRWWTDVLENGPSSPYARYFDIDWSPPKPDLAEKLLLPILGDQYGRVVENQELQVEMERGAFVVRYQDHRLPVAPRTWPVILDPALSLLRSVLGGSEARVLELESIGTAIGHLPRRSETDPERVRERQREKEIVKRRLAALVEGCPEAKAAVEAALGALNGKAGDPRSFDRLEQLLADQAYRLSHWRVAADEINYRRFFDVNELAALRPEEPELFEELLALPRRLMERGEVAGLRVDHVDGLYDPRDYLGRLPAGAYVVVEKILTGDEQLHPDWPVEGTTGYEVLNLLNGVFVDRQAAPAFRDLHALFTGRRDDFRDTVYESKKLVMRVAMSSELTMLARKLDRISEQHRYSRDFTLNSLQMGLEEVIACFPVYRSYVPAAGEGIGAEDERHVLTALRQAKRRNPATSGSLFDFIGSILLLEDPAGLDERQRSERRDFVMRLQQLTGPVMAKGLEDTAFYRHYPLASLNEVGGGPEAFGVALERFHRENLERLRAWPHSLSATSTHDTKRDEDVRARIDVLSEVAEEWERALFRWRELNRGHKSALDEREVPDAEAEYLFYQTLFGVWPAQLVDATPDPSLVARLQAYLHKALREAKRHTSWISPNRPYERAVSDFVAAALSGGTGASFLADFLTFLRPLRRPGLLNSVSQTLLKIAVPGVPDFYQGSELPEFRLVDPDNRQGVDYERRRALLAALDREAAWNAAGLADQLLSEIQDGRLKLFVTARALRFRRARRELFERGDYVPLYASGTRQAHVIAFARAHAGAAAIAAATRFFTRLPARPAGASAWGDTALALPEPTAPRYRDALTGRELRAAPRAGGGGLELPATDVFAHLPVALLEPLP